MTPWERRAEKERVEKEGLPVKVSDYPEFTFHIGPALPWSVRYHAAAARISKLPEYREYLERSRASDYESAPGDDELDRAITAEMLAEGCLISWQGVTDRKGKPLPFSRAAARDFLHEFPDIANALHQIAGNSTHFPAPSLAEKMEISRGNFAPASSSSAARGGKR